MSHVFEQYKLPTMPEPEAVLEGHVFQQFVSGELSHNVQVVGGAVQSGGTKGDGAPSYSLGAVVADEIKDVVETTGEAIDTSTAPLAVYKSTSDGKVYKADADDSSKRRFYGMVPKGLILAAGDKCAVRVQGTLTGFSGLTSGQFLYLTDTAGSVSHTASTTAVIRVAIATSDQEVLIIQKGVKMVTGSVSKACGTADQTTTVTTGFRPRLILCYSVLKGDNSGSCNGNPTICAGAFSDSTGQGATCLSTASRTELITSNYVANSDNGQATNEDIRIAIQSVTETGFDIFIDVYGSGGAGGQADMFYVAFGE